MEVSYKGGVPQIIQKLDPFNFETHGFGLPPLVLHKYFQVVIISNPLDII